MAEYKGSIELISGLTQKNKADFPLMEAHAISVYKKEGNDTVEYRLDDYLNKIGISQKEKDQIIQDVFKHQTFIDLSTKVNGLDTNFKTIDQELDLIQNDISEIKTDITQTYKLVVGNLIPQNVYIYKTSSEIDTDGIEEDVEILDDLGVVTINPKYKQLSISSVYIAGGGGKGELQYKLTLSKITPAAAINLYGGLGIIKYKFSNKEYDDKEEDYITPGGLITAQWYINDTLVATEKNIGVKNDEEERSFDVGPYLRAGDDNIVKLFLNNDEGTTKSTTWIVNSINIGISSSFQQEVAYQEDITVPYTVLGSIEKTVVAELDGKEIFSIVNTQSGRENSFKIPISNFTRGHGSYSLKLYAKVTLNDLDSFIGDLSNINIEDNSFKSNDYNLGIMFAEAGNNTPIISIIPNKLKTIQYDLIEIPYVVYVANNDIVPIQIYDGEELLKTDNIPRNILKSYAYQSKEYYSISDNIEEEKKANTHTITIKSGAGEDSVIIEVEKFPYDITPAANPDLDFNPIGRSNTSDDYNVYYDKYYNTTENIMSVSDNFDWINGGWTVDGSGEPCFLVKSGTTMTLNYPLFEAPKFNIETGTNEPTTFQKLGRNIKFTFKTDLNKEFDSQVLMSYAHLKEGDSYNKDKGIGLRVYSQHAYLSSLSTVTDLVYTDENKIALEFNITPTVNRDIVTARDEDGNPTKIETQTIGEVLGLLDADYSRVITYKDSDSFIQKDYGYNVDNELGYVPLTFGSNECDVYIYNFKVYKRSLTDIEILNNFIASFSKSDEKVAAFKRNQILDDNGLIDPVKLAEANPDLRVIQITIPHMPIDKKDVFASEVKQIYTNGRPEDNWTLKGNIAIRGQGTSSMAYGAAALNLDLNVKDSNDGNDGKALFTYTELIDNKLVTKQTEKYAMSDSDIPEKYFNIKVNVASSENANNALFADDYHQFQPYLRPVRQNRLIGTGEFDEDGNEIMQNIAYKTRDTMKFYPCAIFIHETDVANAKYFTNNQMMFWACGDFGNSKKNSDALGMDKENSYECIVELCNNDDEIVRFKNPDLSNVLWGMDDPKDGKTYSEALEFRFTNGDDKKIFTDETVLLNRASAQRVFAWVEGTNVKTPTNLPIETILENQYNRVYNLLSDFYPQDTEKVNTIWKNIYKINTAGIITTDNQPVYEYNTKEELISKNIIEAKNAGFTLDTAEYRQWKFINEFDKYFISDSTIYHYLYTERHTMIDNRAKNVFMHTEDGTLWDFVFNYDNDTADGIDNLGHLSYDFGVEDIDALQGQIDESGNQLMAFNAYDSVLWCNVRDFLSSRLNTMFNEREAALSNDGKETGAWSASRLINRFNKYQKVKPERLVMTDMRIKYLRPYMKSMDGYNISSYYSQTSDYLPRMLGTKKWQRYYFEKNQEKYISSKYTGSIASTDRISFRIGSQDGGTITIKPFSSMYVNLKMGNGTYSYHKRWQKGDPSIQITLPSAGGNTECDIYTSSRISELEGMSFLKVTSFKAESAEKIKKLVLGSQDPSYNNDNNLTEFSLGANKLLEYLDVSNMRKLSNIGGLENCINLKELYAEGTSITDIRPAPGGLIETLKLNNVTTLILQKLNYLKNISLTNYNSLLKLVIEQCPYISSKKLVEEAAYLTMVRLIDIDWTNTNKISDGTLLNRLLQAKGVGTDFNDTIPQSVLTGQVELESARQAELDAFAAAWPKLNVEYKRLTPQFSLIFNNYEGTLIHRELVDQGTTLTAALHDPTKNGKLDSLPIKPDSLDGRYTYIFTGWKTATNQDLAGTVVGSQDITFIAQYKEDICKYKVEWYSDTKESGSAIVLESIEVPWGTSATYTREIPSKTALNNLYYLFDGWDKSSVNVRTDLQIYPVWATSNPYDLSKDHTMLTAADFNGLKQAPGKLLTKYFTRTNLDGQPEEMWGKSIYMQLGYMPSYNDVPEQVLINSKTIFNGNEENVIVFDDIALFDEDKSFTLAIDFETDYSSTTNTLVSCFARNVNGFKITSANVDGYIPTFEYKTGAKLSVGHIAPSIERGHREICVIRKNKYDKKLYVYTHNRYAFNSSVVETVFDEAVFNSIVNKLCFGALLSMDQTTGRQELSELGTGKIYYAKLWHDDLGKSECENICSWIYDNMEFQFVGSGRYQMGGGGLNTQASFIAKNLLDEPMLFETNQNDESGFGNADIKNWLNSKVFLGVSLQWKQILQKVYVPSLKSTKPNTQTISGDLYLPTPEEYFYIPSRAEMSSDVSSPYTKELSPATSCYPIFTEVESYADSARVKTLGDSIYVSSYLTRSPNPTTTSRQIGVGPDGRVGVSWKPVGTTNTQYYFYKHNEKHGVLVGFSL